MGLILEATADTYKKNTLVWLMFESLVVFRTVVFLTFNFDQNLILSRVGQSSSLGGT